MCIDVEWGAFGDKGSLDFIRTKFDDRLDRTSLLPGGYTYVKICYTYLLPLLSKSVNSYFFTDLFNKRFEKYIGGKYLGELVRLVLEELYQKKLVLQNTPATSFPAPWSLDTKELSSVEQ